MTLLYRAVWDDDWCAPLLVLDDEFKDWCSWKGIAADDVPARGRWTASDRLWIEVRRADAEYGRVMRCILCESDPQGRVWTTTATALVEGAQRTFWVDLECDDPTGGQPQMAAPRLVRGLIQNGGRPTSYGVAVRTDARRLGPGNIVELTDTILDPDRKVPVVVFSPDLWSEPLVTINRADAAAAALAGLAHVYVPSPLAISMFNEALPDGFGVYGGAVRMYLPGLACDDPDDASRHRWIPLRLISAHPNRAATLLAGRLARLQLHQPIPEAWDRLSALLRRPTETEVDTRATAIAESRPIPNFAHDDGALRREIDELTKLLAEADLIREATEGAARAQITRLQASVAANETERYADADELEAVRRERDALRRTIREMSRGDRPTEGAPLDPHDLDTPESIELAIELAKSHLHKVFIPPEALRDIDELEATAKYVVWASTVWQGLLALNDYATAKAAGERPPGLKLWCDTTSAWPTTKLAMGESETVMNNEQLRNQRLFVVASEVDPSGRVHMYSHMKIQVGGGDNIPRVYFYDDTDGTTGGFHIGFIGPHRHVRNTKS